MGCGGAVETSTAKQIGELAMQLQNEIGRGTVALEQALGVGRCPGRPGHRSTLDLVQRRAA